MGEEFGTEEQKKHSVIHILLIILLVILALLFISAGAAYYFIAQHFKTHFFPNVTINGVDCGNMDVASVVSVIESQSREYCLKVIGQDDSELGTLTADDMGLAIDVWDDVENLLAAQNCMEWILAWRSEGNSYDVVYGVTFDADQLEASLGKWDVFQEDQMEVPQDAYLTDYLPEKNAYEIVAETRGSLLDMDKVRKLLAASVEAGESIADLEDAGCYIRAQKTSEDADLQRRAEILNRLVGTKIIYDWNGAEVILDGSTIHDWIIEERDEISVDEEAVTEFVAANARKNDTYGKTRRFTTVQGQTLSLLSGGYGWKVNRSQETEELLKLILEGYQGEREPVYTYQAAYKGVEDDIGPSYVEIDLTNQHLYLFIDGKIEVESDLVSGNMSNGSMTPPGVFGLTYKTRNAVLRGANYESKVSYWMPFNGNIGMHDATWRSSFGGDIFLTNGSHGCVNLPLDKAKEIYSYVSKGFPVICYYY